ncbi:late protein L2 [Camelus dromedarius papillomavirus 3]|nr:late protein L2 [Camelus dromedarius papillomavirus 3]
MASRKRVRRANPYELYRTCKANNTCPPDIIPMVEGNTIADQILKWGSWAVYLGGLGIGTGTEGITGRPVEVPTIKTNIERLLVRLFGKGGGQSRPPTTGGIPLETLGTIQPTDNVVDVAVGSESDAPLILTSDTSSNGSSTGGDVITDRGGDTVVTLLEDTNTSDNAAIDFRPLDHNPTSRVLSTTRYVNPVYLEPVTEVAVGETSNAENIFLSGQNIGGTGGEEIELTLFTEPKTSTPRATPAKVPRGRDNWFSTRYYSQVQINPFAGTSESEFINPAFEGSSFEAPPGYSEWLPDYPQLQDATHFSASRLLQGRSGRIGVDRVAQTDTITTRSGLRIGGQVHVRHSLSSIPDVVELVTFTDGQVGSIPTVETAFVEETAPFEEIDLDSTSVYSDADLIDDYSPAPHGHLVIGDRYERDIVPVPTVESLYKGWFPVDVTGPPETKYPIITPGSNGDLTPGVVIDDTDDFYRHYYLHESLLRRGRQSRKRRYV